MRSIAVSFILFFLASPTFAGDYFDKEFYWESSNCRTSNWGSFVLCGGQSSSCRTSPDGRVTSCGGWAKFIEAY